MLSVRFRMGMGGVSALCPQRRVGISPGGKHSSRGYIGITMQDSFKGGPDIKHRCWILSERVFSSCYVQSVGCFHCVPVIGTWH